MFLRPLYRRPVTDTVTDESIIFITWAFYITIYPKFDKTPSLNRKDFGNTALFFTPDGKVVGQYLKIHLVPFSEEVPYRDIIPWPKFIVPKGKRSYQIPGKEFSLFGIDGTQFGVLICWEIVFPELFRKFVKNGANFMINVTNEGWFGKTAAPYQMAAVNVFRAVENRIAVARAANTGISCFIDPYGRITDRVRSNNTDIFVSGYLTREIPLTYERTFYTIHGDLFVYLVLSIAILVLALTVFRPRN